MTNPMNRNRKVLFAGLLVCAMHGVQADTPVLNFTGNNSYVNIGAPPSLQIPSSSPFTIEGWVYLNSVSGVRMLYSKGNARTSPYTYMFGVNGSTMLYAYTGAGGIPANTWRSVTLSPALTTTHWYHLAYSYDGTNLAFYRDGSLAGTQPYSFGNTEAHTVKISGYASTTDLLGWASDVRVWNHARSQAQIQQFMPHRLIGHEPGLLGYWRLDEGAGSATLDATPNGGDGAILNATWTHSAELAFSPYAFALLDPLTGNAHYTSTNEVDVLLPLRDLAGYDLYQFSTNNAAPSEGWLAFDTNTPPATVTFAVPDPEGQVTLYCWLKDAAGTLPVLGLVATTTYVHETADVTAIAKPYLAPTYGPVWPAVIRAANVDNGSYASIGLYGMRVAAAENETPATDYTTLTEPGEYTVTLTVTDLAGNADSTTTTVTVESVTNRPCALAEVPQRWLTATADSATRTGSYDLFLHEARFAIDGDTASYWQSTALPAWLRIDLGASYPFGGLELLAQNNRIAAYAVYVTDDTGNWGDPVAVGTLPDSAAWTPIWGGHVQSKSGRYVMLQATARYGTAVQVDEIRCYANLPLALASPDTGHLLYTRENTVIVTNFPCLTGYDQYQISESSTEPVGGWLAYDPEQPPATATFEVPFPEGPVKLYAWLRDSTEILESIAFARTITYVRNTADVQAVAPAQLTVHAWGAVVPALLRAGDPLPPRRKRGQDVDAGSSSSIGLYDRQVACPDDDTPGIPDVTLSKLGATTVTLTATDAAGNTDSTPIAVTVASMEHHVATNRARENFAGPANTRTWPMGWVFTWPQQWLSEHFNSENQPNLYLTTGPSGRVHAHQNVNAYITDWAAKNVRVAADINHPVLTQQNYAGLWARFLPDDPDTTANERRGYQLWFYPYNQTLYLRRYAGGASANLASVVGAFNYLVWNRVVLEVEQQGPAAVRLRAKMWPRTDPEPADWDLVFVDNAALAVRDPGLVGIYGVTSGNRYRLYANFEARNLARASLIIVR